MRDVTYHKHYVCTVQSQHANGLLDVLPDDETIRGTGLSSIPIRHGLPGCTIEVAAGASLLLGFENGDPSKPYCALWESGLANVIRIDIGENPADVARKGDTVEVLLPPAVFSGTIGGSPATGMLTFPTNKTLGTIVIGSTKLGVGS